MTRLGVVTLVVDAARDRAARPLKGEFLQQPRLPIREQYLYRLLVNMVWFARNYLNFIIVCVLAMSYWYPLVLISLSTSFAVHVKKDHKQVAPALKVFQFLGCVLNYYFYGVIPPLVVSFFVLSVVFTHALVTPYTDEASTLYEDLTKADESFPAPGTPVQEYTGTNKFGPHQISGTTPNKGTSGDAVGATGGPLSGMPPLDLGAATTPGNHHTSNNSNSITGGSSSHHSYSGATAGAAVVGSNNSGGGPHNHLSGNSNNTSSGAHRKTTSSKGQPVQVATHQGLSRPVPKRASKGHPPIDTSAYYQASSLPDTISKNKSV